MRISKAFVMALKISTALGLTLSTHATPAEGYPANYSGTNCRAADPANAPNAGALFGVQNLGASSQDVACPLVWRGTSTTPTTVEVSYVDGNDTTAGVFRCWTYYFAPSGVLYSSPSTDAPAGKTANRNAAATMSVTAIAPLTISGTSPAGNWTLYCRLPGILNGDIATSSQLWAYRSLP